MKRSKISIYAALAANIGIATIKFIAGGFSGSSAMIAEGVHSLVDSVNELLLLYGIYSSNKQRDNHHPFGYGRELYFWSFIVSILIFSLGAGVSFYQGYVHLKTPALSGPHDLELYRTDLFSFIRRYFICHLLSPVQKRRREGLGMERGNTQQGSCILYGAF